MVDEVLASCYADFHHDVAHLAMIPMQQFSEVMGYIFGEEGGFPIFVNTAREFGIYLAPIGNFWNY